MSERDDPSEIERLRAQVAAQEAEIARLRQASEGRGTTRRDVLRGAGLIAGGLAAAAAVAGTAGSKPAVAVEGHNIRLQGRPSWIFLKLNGTDIHGESDVSSLGREDAIQGEYFQSKVFQVLSSSTGLPSGQRRYEPIVIRKRVDKSSPLLLKGLVQNEVADAVFKFYRPNPTGDGTTEQYYTIEIKQGRIIGVNQYAPQANDSGASAPVPEMEEVQFVFNTIEWTYEDGGITFQDSFSTKA